MSDARLLLQIGCVLYLLLVSSANREENFLHSGCTVSSEVTNVLNTSLFLVMQYPPKDGFSVRISQGQEDYWMKTKSGLANPRQSWIPVEVITEGKLEVRFSNGTSWLSNGTGPLISPLPSKRLELSNGFLLPDCPQGLPNWQVSNGAEPRTINLENGDEEVFSITMSHESKFTLEIGIQEFVICQANDNNEVLVIGKRKSKYNSCSEFSALRVLWLKIALKSQMVEISDPSQRDKILMKYHEPAHEMLGMTFKDEIVNGYVYVVHHLRGFVEQGAKMTAVRPVPQGSRLRISTDKVCLVVSASVGILGFLIILVLIFLSLLFYLRWQNLKQVYIMMQEQRPKTGSNYPPGKNRNQELKVPSQLAPNIRTAEENNYLTPRECKILPGREERKSEHIYEELLPYQMNVKNAKGKGTADGDQVNLVFNHSDEIMTKDAHKWN